jgi:NADH dehydrogenase FAD-containing subunit
VVLSYRGEAFDRAKARNRERVERAAQEKRLQVLLKSNVRQIEREQVAIERNGELLKVRNDAVIVSAGGVLPSDFLRRIGISVETKYGTA